MAAEIVIRLVGQNDAKDVKQGIDDISNSAQQGGGHFSALGEIATGAMRAIGEAAVSAATGGISMIFGAIQGGIADAREANMLMAQTENVITSTGGAAGVSAQHVADYASALSDAAGQSLFGDDQIQQSTNLLLTFTNIKGTVLDAATAISVDMAQALGGAPKDSAIQLGKALNDPIAGITALSRVGVSFSEEQKGMIKTMQESGDVAGAQGIILAELNKEFGGSALAAAKADGGMAQFKGIMGETAEALGHLLLPVLNMLFQQVLLPGVQVLSQVVSAVSGDKAAFESLTPTLQNVVNGIQQVIQFISGVIQSFQAGGQGASTMGGVLQTLGGVVAWLGSAWQALQPVITNVVNALANVIQAVFGVVQTFIQAHGAQISAFMTQAWQQIMTIVKTGIDLYNAIVPPILNAIAGFIRDHGATIQAVLSAAWQAISGLIDAALTLIQGVLKAALQIIQGDWSGAWTTIKEMSARIVQDLWQVIKAGFDQIKAIFDDFGPKVLAVVERLASDMVRSGAAVVENLRRGIEDGWGALLKWFDDKLKELTAKLPFSEPKDTSSPLYGLGRSGMSLVRNFAQGVREAMPELGLTMTDMTRSILEPLQRVADAAHKIIADMLAAAVSGSRTAVTNFDSIDQMRKAAEDAKQRAYDALQQANAQFQQVRAQGDAQIAAAQAAADEANKILSNAKTPDEIARATAALDKANADLAKAQADAAAARAEAAHNVDVALAANDQAEQAYQTAMVTIMTTQQQLTDAETQAAVISQSNAQAGADYLALKSSQVFEMLGLQQQLADAQNTGNTAEVARLTEKINLVAQAQAAELLQFQQHADDLAQAQSDMIDQMAIDGEAGGNSIVAGMVAGIQAGTGALVDAMRTTIQAAIDAAMAALNAHSPSQVFMKIGGFAMEGMALGITGGAPMVAGAVSGAAGGAISAGTNTVNNYYSLSYETRQSTGSVAHDIRLLSMLG